MGKRKEALADNHVYHVYTRSISEFNVFRKDSDYQRFIDTLNFYTAVTPPCKFSAFLELSEDSKTETLQAIANSAKLVKILSFCIMPTHVHLVLEQQQENGITKFMSAILMSYSLFFNKQYNRKGPLWESRFRTVHVESDEQLLHLTRYVHLNPVSVYITNDPKDWKFSSYKEYTQNKPEYGNGICSFSHCMQINPQHYEKFVCERIKYQRELQKIKHLFLD
ncbi:MAG: transposase [Elusimicrobiota bacterium]